MYNRQSKAKLFLNYTVTWRKNPAPLILKKIYSTAEPVFSGQQNGRQNLATKARWLLQTGVNMNKTRI